MDAWERERLAQAGPEAARLARVRVFSPVDFVPQLSLPTIHFSVTLQADNF